MRSLRFNREGTLKGLLLFALVGNLTWEPLAKQFSEMDFSSTQAGRLDCRGKDKADARCKPATVAERNKIIQNGANIEAEIAQSTGKTTAAPKVSSETEAKVVETCVDCEKTEDQKKISKLQTLAKTTLTTTTEQAEQAKASRVVTRPSLERIQNCEITADGEELTDMQALKCNTKLLASLKSKDSSSRRKELARKIESLYTSLRKEAKADVFSKESDRRTDGERTITEMLAALNSVRFDRDSARTEMIESLEALRAGAEARVAAADLEEDVADLETEMKDSWRDLNKLTRDFQNSCRTRTGCDRDIYDQLQDQQSRVGELREEHQELAQTINDEQDEAIDTLDEYRDGMTRTELRDYTSPFAKLKSRMETMVDARKLGASNVGNQTAVDAIPGRDQAFLERNGLPADFYDVRSGNTAIQRGNGMYQAPTTTQVPMGSPQNINTQLGQQQYTPQYMQVPGMNQGGSLLPAPGGMMNGGQQQMMRPPMEMGMGNQQIVPVPGQQFGQQMGGMRPPMFAGQQQMMLPQNQQIMPVMGGQQFGQPQQMGGGSILPVPR